MDGWIGEYSSMPGDGIDVDARIGRRWSPGRCCQLHATAAHVGEPPPPLAPAPRRPARAAAGEMARARSRPRAQLAGCHALPRVLTPDDRPATCSRRPPRRRPPRLNLVAGEAPRPAPSGAARGLLVSAARGSRAHPSLTGACT